MLCEFQARLLYIGSSRAARTMERPCLETHHRSGLECVHIAIYFGFLCKILFYAFSFNCLSTYSVCVFVCMQARVYSHICHSTWVGRSIHGERFLLCYVDPGTWTQVSRLWGKCLYQLSRLSSPEPLSPHFLKSPLLVVTLRKFWLYSSASRTWASQRVVRQMKKQKV